MISKSVLKMDPDPATKVGRADLPSVADGTQETAVTLGRHSAAISARQPGFSIWPWLVLACLAAGGWSLRDRFWLIVEPYLGTKAAKQEKPGVRAIPVVTTIVQQKDMAIYINGLGTVTAFKTVTLRSRVEGELVKVAFNEGQMVREGELLMEIDRRPFDVQRQQAEGQLARDGATLKSAEITLKRYQELIASKALSPQQLDEQLALVKQTSGAIQSDQAAIENAKLQLTYCQIISPISGRIGLRLVDQGNIVRANDPSGLAVITQLQPIALIFTIPQDDIWRVQKQLGAEKPLVVDAYDRDFKTKLATGTLLAIDNQVDATTGTVRLKAQFDNEDGLLFPNQFVNARLLVDTKRDAVVVSSAAVQRGPDSNFVYIVKDDETVELRTVTISISEGAETVIESGLKPREIVVTDGVDKLQPKSKVATRDREQKSGAGAEKNPSTDGKKLILSAD